MDLSSLSSLGIDVDEDRRCCHSMLSRTSDAVKQTPAIPSFGQKKRRKIQTVEQVLAEDLKKLSIMEREKVFESIHGIGSEIKETPAMIEEALSTFDRLLRETPSESKEDYLEAERQNADYVQSNTFRIRWIRACSYNIPKATNNFRLYFKEKRVLFGSEALARDVRLSQDFDETDLKCLRSGQMTLLPEKDSAGRYVATWIQHFEKYTTQNRLRCIFYLFQVMSADEEAQRKGFVALHFNFEQASNIANSRAETKRMVAYSPIRLSAGHFCCGSAKTAAVLNTFSGILDALGKFARLRMKSHHGTMMEIKYDLMRYGIRVDKLPNSLNEPREHWLKYHYDWMESQIGKEMSGNIDAPSPIDILLGTDKTAMNHPGNNLFRKIIEDHLPSYNTAGSKKYKTNYAGQLVLEIRSSGARFLKKSKNGGFEQVDDLIARNKVTTAFRSKRKAIADEQIRVAKRRCNGDNSIDFDNLFHLAVDVEDDFEALFD